MKLEHPMNPFAEADEVRIVAIPMSPEDEGSAKKRISNFLALRDVIRYDFQQRLGDQTRVYCSELVLLAIQGLTTDPNAVPSEIAGRPAFTPDSVAACGTTLFERRLKK